MALSSSFTVSLLAALLLAAATAEPASASTVGGAARVKPDEEVRLLGTDAGTTEEALAQMTVGLHALGMLGNSGAAQRAAFKGDTKLAGAFDDHMKEVGLLHRAGVL